jgi:internalin A
VDAAAHRVDPAGRVGGDRVHADKAGADALEYGVPREAGESRYFSYANDSDYADDVGEPQRLPVQWFCDKVQAKKGITIRGDVEELRYGDEIEAFMRELAAGDRIFVWLTDAYLRSPYCMYELHEIWRTSGE